MEKTQLLARQLAEKQQIDEVSRKFSVFLEAADNLIFPCSETNTVNSFPRDVEHQQNPSKLSAVTVSIGNISRISLSTHKPKESRQLAEKEHNRRDRISSPDAIGGSIRSERSLTPEPPTSVSLDPSQSSVTCPDVDSNEKVLPYDTLSEDTDFYVFRCHDCKEHGTPFRLLAWEDITLFIAHLTKCDPQYTDMPTLSVNPLMVKYGTKVVGANEE
ncbi:hypothetical protein N431DRAFT_465768 [Stipitochalara longipes BDJ]|nr:hypothetical protein N431DRAFT_465768 [Stipitochalara longipes BDJ]